MGEAIVRLLGDETMRRRMGERAADDAAARFSLDRQVRAYLDWFACIVERERSTRPIVATQTSRRRAA
jgi:hypothetical protein